MKITTYEAILLIVIIGISSGIGFIAGRTQTETNTKEKIAMEKWLQGTHNRAVLKLKRVKKTPMMEQAETQQSYVIINRNKKLKQKTGY